MADAAAQLVRTRQGDAWSFGVLLCTLALHGQSGRGGAVQKGTSLLYLGGGAAAKGRGGSERASANSAGEADPKGGKKLTLKQKLEALKAEIAARTRAGNCTVAPPGTAAVHLRLDGD